MYFCVSNDAPRFSFWLLSLVNVDGAEGDGATLFRLGSKPHVWYWDSLDDFYRFGTLLYDKDRFSTPVLKGS